MTRAYGLEIDVKVGFDYGQPPEHPPIKMVGEAGIAALPSADNDCRRAVLLRGDSEGVFVLVSAYADGAAPLCEMANVAAQTAVERLSDGPLPRRSPPLTAEDGQPTRIAAYDAVVKPDDNGDAPGPVTPGALVVLAQRIRPDAKDTLDYFARQNVSVKVISGDNATSVGAVATCRTTVNNSPRRSSTSPCSATSPRHRNGRWSALQSCGHTVAMTGDGVLAIKDADIGVTMGAGSAATCSVALSGAPDHVSPAPTSDRARADDTTLHTTHTRDDLDEITSLSRQIC